MFPIDNNLDKNENIINTINLIVNIGQSRANVIKFSLAVCHCYDNCFYGNNADLVVTTATSTQLHYLVIQL